MRDVDEVIARLRAAGSDLPDDVLEMVAPMLGPLLDALDGLVGLDFGATEPFVPARQLVDDAAP